MIYDTQTAAARGLRRIDDITRTAERIADRFEGLPEGLTRWRLMAAVRTAASLLGLTPSMLQLLEHYVDCSYDIDWTAGSEPVITRQLIETAERMGKSERQIRNIERSLAERGLLVWRDSGNHQRRGQRDRTTGRLRYAYGPSLAPMAARAVEMLALAERVRSASLERRRLRLAISAMQRRLQAIYASHEDRSTEPLEPTVKLLLRKRLTARMTDEELIGLHDDMVSLCDKANQKMQTRPDDDTEAEIHCRTSTDTKTDTEGMYSADEKPAPDDRKNSKPEATPQTALNARNLTPQMVAAAASFDMSALIDRNGSLTWGRLNDAAQAMAPMVGIDKTTWGHACEALGRNQATMAIVVLDQGIRRTGRHRYPPIRQPKRYLETLMKRGMDGTLHLERSIRSLIAERKADGEIGINRAARALATPSSRRGDPVDNGRHRRGADASWHASL